MKGQIKYSIFFFSISARYQLSIKVNRPYLSYVLDYNKSPWDQTVNI